MRPRNGAKMSVFTPGAVFLGPEFEFPFPRFADPQQARRAIFDALAADQASPEVRAAAAEAKAQQQAKRAFYVSDLGIVKRQYQRWCTQLPRARPFYAMKCNPDPVLSQLLANQGAGFDCASAAEIEQALSTGVRPDEIIFANPIKDALSLQYARAVGVNKMTFDNADELHKIHAHHPDAELVLRILADDSHSLMRFGTKFGAPFESVEGLMTLAKQLQLRVVGIAFHIGSGCFSTKAHSAAVELARQCFDVAERIGLPRLRLLDIGGGFPGDLQVGVRPDGSPGFECLAGALREAFARHFPEERYPELQIIGEPGRYFATSWATLFTAVVGKRSVVQPPAPVASGVASSSVLAATTSAGGPRQQARALHTEPEKKPRFLYYITDGVYGSFNCLIFDHAVAVPVPAKRLLSDAGVDAKLPASVASSLGTFFGPTCDSMDVVAKDVEMEELHVGDWVGFEAMGAYTSAAASRFNGIDLPIKQYVDSMPEVPNTKSPAVGKPAKPAKPSA